MDLKKTLSSLTIDADWIGLKEVRENQRFYSVRNGILESPGISMGHGIMASALIEGQFVYAATQDLTTSGVETALKQAIAQSQKVQSYNLFAFSSSQRKKAQGEYKKISLLDKSSLDHDIIQRLFELNGKLRLSDKIMNATSFMMMIESESRYVCTHGSDYEQAIDLFTTNLMATASDGKEIQSRSSGMPCYQRNLDLFLSEDMDKKAHKISEEAIELLEAELCPTGQYDLLLMPDQLYLQVHESIGHPLELDRILGDERNYAGWSFVKQNDFGNLSYGSPLLNVTFDPSLNDEYASYAYDDCGNQATKEYLIKDGILQRALGSLESQARTSVSGVANFRSSSWNRPPLDRMANINIEPGETSLDTMIKNTEKGVIMMTNRSWSIDDYRVKFQFGCEYAKMIENGVVTKTFKKPNYKGITLDFWHSLKMVGDQNSFESWGSPWCGKGEPNQVIRVGHAIPPCLFEKIDIFADAA